MSSIIIALDQLSYLRYAYVINRRYWLVIIIQISHKMSAADLFNSEPLFTEAEVQEIFPKVNKRKFEVICRVRPQDEPDIVSDITVNEEKASITITSDQKKKKKQFTFHKIYNENTPQSTFTNEIIDEIFSANDNYQSSLVLAYGVTNSGKTYTILGNEQEPGLLPVLMQRIFEKYPSEQVRVMAIESYNDEFYSLNDKAKLYSKEVHGQFQFEDYKPEPASQESIREMIRGYAYNRSQTDTKANKKSSRSHAIFKIICPAISVAIVDLAGSERLNKAGSNLAETSSINTSLLVLGKCIHAFRDGKVIPYRESKLTKVLSEFFYPEYKIFMVTHINRSGDMFHENVNVLEYAAVSTKVKHLNIHMNKSLYKSAKKRQDLSKSVSVIKGKPLNGSRINKSKITEQEDPEEQNPLLEVMRKEAEQRRKRMYQDYIYKTLGYWEAVDEELDRQFEELDRKDRAMIEEWRKITWQTPVKTKVPIEVKKAETRIKLRQQILQEIAKEKAEKQCQIAIGTSLFKSQSKQQQNKQEQQEQEVILDPKDEDYVSQPEEPTFFQKVVASTKKLTTVKCKMNEYVTSAINIIKSYSHKKEKSARQKKMMHLHSNNLNWCIDNTNKQDIEYAEKPFITEQTEKEDYDEFCEKFVHAYKRIKLSTDSEQSQLLDAVRQPEELHKEERKQNSPNKEEEDLPCIRESEQYGHPDPSPHFRQSSNIPQNVSQNRVNHPQQTVQVALSEYQQSNEPQQKNQIPPSEEKQNEPEPETLKITEKQTEEKPVSRIEKIEEQPQRHPYLRKRSKMPQSVDKETKAHRKMSGSSSVTSVNEDSNSTVNMNNRGRNMKRTKKSKDSRPHMEFKVCRSISPLQTRAQRKKAFGP